MECRPRVAQLIIKAKTLAIEARQPNTVRKYMLYYKKFAQWCKENKQSFLPATGCTTGLYLTHLIDGRSSISCFHAAVYSIKWAHGLCGLDDPTLHQLPALLIETAKRKLSKQRQPTAPITTDVLKKLCDNFSDKASIRHRRFISMALLAFTGFLRIGELRNLRRSDVSFMEDYLKLQIKKSKADVYGRGAEVCIARKGGEYCPIKNLQLYLLLTENLSPSDLFIFRHLNGPVLTSTNVPISYGKARSELRWYLERVLGDASSFGWHSFRHGGVTAAANKGVPDRLLKAHGRWRSESAKDGYIHESLQARLSVTNIIDL